MIIKINKIITKIIRITIIIILEKAKKKEMLIEKRTKEIGKMMKQMKNLRNIQKLQDILYVKQGVMATVYFVQYLNKLREMKVIIKNIVKDVLII